MKRHIETLRCRCAKRRMDDAPLEEAVSKQDSIKAADVSETCPFCTRATGDRNWPHIRLPIGEGQENRLVHFRCAFTNDIPGFNDDIKHLMDVSPELKSPYEPQVRIGWEDAFLHASAEGIWPPPSLPLPPKIAFSVEGIIELRISACSALRTVPPEIGNMHGMQALVFIANSLEELPPEVGKLHCLKQLYLNGNYLRTLPREICELPILQEICLDSNLVEWVPNFTSPHLELFTAPGNFLTTLPEMSPALTRLEVHGNRIRNISFPLRPWPGTNMMWEKMQSLKIMGNHLEELPEEMDRMPIMRILCVANNRLKALPKGIFKMERLEWLFVYDNAIVDLPEGILKKGKIPRLARALFEGNPLSFQTLRGLFEDGKTGTCRTVGLDMMQVDRYRKGALEAGIDGTCIPRCMKIGKLMGIGGPGEHYYMKLVPSSQIRPHTDRPVEESLEPRAEFLVVGFSASQAEPEWLGFLSRIAALESTELLEPPTSSLEQLLRDQGALKENKAVMDVCTYEEREASIAAMWSRCKNGLQTAETKHAGKNGSHSASKMFDFDVLCVVDHRMSWYGSDASGFSNALFNITKKYKRVLCLGASMGGFGAILHGGRVADAVVAFGPQGRLASAALRPQAEGPEALDALTCEVQESVRLARSRGCFVEAHCAADDHLWHCLQLRLADMSLTVHPICPRKPFARVLDKVKVLVPIVLDALHRLAHSKKVSEVRPPPEPFTCLATASSSSSSAKPAIVSASPTANGTNSSIDVTGPLPSIAVASWNPHGGFGRYDCPGQELLHLLFRAPCPDVPRPGNWYCPRCGCRNVTSKWMCKWCRDPEVNVTKAIRIPDGTYYPREGDWGCGKCGEALCGYQDYCSACWTPQSDPRNMVMAQDSVTCPK